MHGLGKEVWADGDSYIGDFAVVDNESHRHGQGVYKWADGRQFVGKFDRGSKVGKGKMILADGTVQEGECDNDEFLAFNSDEYKEKQK